jgi:hypothetical protein
MSEPIDSITTFALTVASNRGFGEVEVSEDTYVTIACDRASTADYVYDTMVSVQNILDASAIAEVGIDGRRVTIWRA